MCMHLRLFYLLIQELALASEVLEEYLLCEISHIYLMAIPEVNCYHTPRNECGRWLSVKPQYH